MTATHETMTGMYECTFVDKSQLCITMHRNHQIPDICQYVYAPIQFTIVKLIFTCSRIATQILALIIFDPLA
jgi:hypothetical protein